jgi:signal transduction histidine kinase/ActR/RegA family two-component response regulator
MQAALADLELMRDTFAELRQAREDAQREAVQVRLNVELQQMLSSANRLAEAVEKRQQGALRVALWWGMLALALLAGLTLAFTWMVGRRVSGPLERLRDGARRIGSGDFAHRVGLERDDEMGELSRALDDMTERLMQLAALKTADRRKDEFLAMLAHELRNPLAPITTAAHLLKVADGNPAVREQARAVIERQARHLSRLVDDLLDVSRITRGKVELRREHVALQTIVERAVETVRPLVVARNHRIDIDVPRQAVWLHADPVRLVQVVANLLNNAAKYMPPGGLVAVRARAELGAATIEVVDRGSGIEPELLPRVFELFTQGQRTLDRTESGLGIGLTLAKSLTELHGGSVSAQSEGRGKGSTFTVTLPCLTAVPDLRRTAAPQRPAQAARTVLVVDDNAEQRDTLALLLRTHGHEVHAAADGPGALALAAELGPELVFLDIGLPGMDGFAIAERLRETLGEHVVLVALTGYAGEEKTRKAGESGFDHYLVKPADPVRIVALASEPLRSAASA